MVSENSKNKNPKIRSFFVFLFLATLFWFLTKFSQDTQAVLTANIEYVSVPNTIVVADNTLKKISFELAGNGFQLLSHKIKKTTLKIDLEQYYKEGDSIIVIPLQELQKLSSKQLNITEIKTISVSELIIHLDKNASKKVPVVLRSEISFKDGYFQQGEIQIIPDSVLIRGPLEELDTINQISTKILKKKELSESFEESVALIPIKNKNLSLSSSSAKITMNVEEFSQMRLEIPLEVKNVPEEINLKLFPEKIGITFDVSLKDFGSIQAEDFDVVCDFSERIEEGSFMIPKLVRFPDNLQHLELETKKVEFLIFK
ncbi:MAG: CdaR family protein [Flavobacteriaceae bacterium]